jgi:transposase InsO family protein
MSALCREFEISRKTGYKWLRRYRAGGEAGLGDRSRRPGRSPSRASPELEHRVVALKQRYPYWGPRKLHRLLRHGVSEEKMIAVSTVARILSRYGLVRVPEEPVVYPAVGRFEYAHANDLWQMDLKAPIRLPDGRKVYPVGLLDDHSRYALGLWLVPDQTDQQVLACWITAARTYGLPLQTLTDHGAQFGMEPQETSAFRAYLWACGVGHIQGRVKHPQTQGKVERFWGTFRCELMPRLQARPPDDWPALMEAWQCQYNRLRPHESVQDNPPASRYRPSERPFVEPDRHARVGLSTSVYRRVTPRGQIHLSGQRLMVGRGLAGWMVEARPLGNGCWHIYFRNHFIREFLLTPTPATATETKLKPVTYVPEHVLPMC